MKIVNKKFAFLLIHKWFQKLGICQGGALNLGQALPAPKQLNLKSLAMQAGPNSVAVRRRQKPMFETICV